MYTVFDIVMVVISVLLMGLGLLSFFLPHASVYDPDQDVAGYDTSQHSGIFFFLAGLVLCSLVFFS